MVPRIPVLYTHHRNTHHRNTNQLISYHWCSGYSGGGHRGHFTIKWIRYTHHLYTHHQMQYNTSFRFVTVLHPLITGWFRHSHMVFFVAYLLSNPNIGSNNSPTKQTAGEKVVDKRETAI